MAFEAPVDVYKKKNAKNKGKYDMANDIHVHYS